MQHHFSLDSNTSPAFFILVGYVKDTVFLVCLLIVENQWNNFGIILSH